MTFDIEGFIAERLAANRAKFGDTQMYTTDPSSRPSPSSSSAPDGGPVSTLSGLSAKVAGENVGSSSSSSSSSDYGLGAWGSRVINPGDLSVLLLHLIGGNQKTTGDNLVKAFSQAAYAKDPRATNAVAQIQRALNLGGYYSKTYTPNYGVVKPEDVTAFGQAVMLAGKAGASVSDVLEQAAKFGAISGVDAMRAQAQQPTVAKVTLPATQDLEAEAIAAFNKILGHDATPKQAAAFAAMYRSMSAGVQRANNRAEYAASQQAAGGLSGGQVQDLAQQADQSSADQLKPYKGHDPALQGGLVTPDGEVVGKPPPVANSRLGPMVGQETGPLIYLDPHDPKYGQPYDPARSFDQQINSLGQVIQQAQQQATPQIHSGLTQLNEETPEDPSVAAANFAQNVAPRRAAAKSIAGQFDQFLQLLSQSFGG